MVMTTDYGQLFTVEGITAAVIMVGTGFLIINSTTLYTQGDIHIYDLHLEQLANDMLLMLDSSDNYQFSANNVYDAKKSLLEGWVRDEADANFEEIAHDYLISRSEGQDNLKFIMYQKDQNGIKKLTSYPITYTPEEINTILKTEHLVRATRLVYAHDPDIGDNQVYLVEVYIWRN
jgi:hypothetical protein